MDEYFLSLMPEKTGILKELYDIAIEKKVPIVREDTAGLLKVLINTIKPKRILEAGTAIGYSSILMAKASSEECLIDTVEIDLDSVVLARENIKKADLSHRIHVIAGDMQEVFNCLNTRYDMIFLDGAKSRYIDVYNDILRLLNIGGILVCDNIIYHGKIYREPMEVSRKYRTIVQNLRAFLEKLTADDRFVTSILETGDGISVSSRIK